MTFDSKIESSSYELFSERLYLRPPRESDLSFYLKLYQNKAVMRLVSPDGNALSEKLTKERLDVFIDHWKTKKFGVFVLEWKDSDTKLGYCGLRYLADTDKLELGYIIDEEHWGKGIASEAARRCIQYAKENLSETSVYAVVDPKNPISQHVLTKLGFTRNPSMDGFYYGRVGLAFRRDLF